MNLKRKYSLSDSDGYDCCTGKEGSLSQYLTDVFENGFHGRWRYEFCYEEAKDSKSEIQRRQIRAGSRCNQENSLQASTKSAKQSTEGTKRSRKREEAAKKQTQQEKTGTEEKG